MPAFQSGSRITDNQKRMVICPVCLAGVGKPCIGYARDGKTPKRDDGKSEIKKIHPERTRMALGKVAREKLRTTTK